MLVNRVPSGGTTPNSVTIHHGVAYVLNAGGTGNISGFRLGRHGLVPLSGATQPLSSAAAGAVQVSFTPARRPARRLGEGRQHDRHLSGRPLGPRRSRHAPRLGGSRAIRVRVRQARLPARDRGGRQCAELLPARPVHDDHRVAPERPGRGLLGRLDEQRAPRLYRQRGDRLHLRILGGLERQPLAAHPGRSDGPARSRHPSAGRGDLPRPLPLRQRRQHRDDQRLQDRRERLADLARQRRAACPAGFGGLVVSS